MKPMTDDRAALTSAVLGLRQRLSSADAKGYVREPVSNLVPGIRLEQFEDDLREGDGGELRIKFCAAHSSAALAVNAFAPFKDRPEELLLNGRTGADSIRFEKRLTTIQGRRPANLDVWIERENDVVAIESKLLEYMTEKKPEFAKDYDKLEPLCRGTGWWSTYCDAKSGSQQYLDRAQLLKHYFGLRRLQDGGETRSLTLLYLFWEPANAADIDLCRVHRDQVESFASQVAHSSIKFEWLAYPALWGEWRRSAALSDHAANLEARYSLSI